MFRFWIACVLLALAVARAEAQSVVTCDTADNLTLVAGGSDCLALLSFGVDDMKPGGTLTVFLHGDVSSGGPSDSFKRIAPQFAGPGRMAAVLIRQGYYDEANRQSTGSNYNRGDNATPKNVENIGAALERLKAHHRAGRLVVIGHSRGSNIAGVLLARKPGLIDAAVLFSCPCDLETRHNAQRKTGTPRSQSPLDFVSSMPAEAWIATITGDKDDNTNWSYLKRWHEALKKRGIAVRDLVLPGEQHNWSTRWFANADVRALLEEAAGK